MVTYVWSLIKSIEAENRAAMARAWVRETEGGVGQRMQRFSYMK